MSFALYPDERNIFRFAEYGALLEAVRGCDSVLEFGPGVSTLALIEAGCGRIVTCEYDPVWLGRAKQMFVDYPQVQVLPYANRWEDLIPGLAGGFDIAFVDSPVGEGSRRVEHPEDHGRNRANTVYCALQYAPVVLLHDAKRAGEQRTLEQLVDEGYDIVLIDTPKGIARISRC